MLYVILLPLAAVALLCAPFLMSAKRVKQGKSAKPAFIGNLCTFGGVMLTGIIVPFGKMIAYAADEGAAKAVVTTGTGLAYIGAALAVGLACVGAGIAVGAGAPAAIGATSEAPKNFVKSLISVALGEGIAIYGLLISILIVNNLG